jgi:hypothetical protein
MSIISIAMLKIFNMFLISAFITVYEEPFNKLETCKPNIYFSPF